jgi:Zn-dependent peptidase ImmA (M78 family)
VTPVVPERPQVLPEQLRLARESLYLSIEEVSSDLGFEPRDLIAWEEGLSEPSVGTLWALADFYGRPTDYFLTNTPSRPTKVDFRSVTNLSLAELPLSTHRVLVQFEELCRGAAHLSHLAGDQPNIRIQRQPQADPVTLASSERLRLGFDSQPIKKLRERLSIDGIWIFELAVSGHEFSGLSWWHSTYGPCILVNAGDTQGRRNFTLAHELAHLIRSGPDVSTICDPALFVAAEQFIEERLANRFAAAFLIPADDMVHQVQSHGIANQTVSNSDVQSLARRYGVSLEAAIYRLEELDVIDQPTKSKLLATGESKGFVRSPRGPRWRRRLGERYVDVAFRAYRAGQLSLPKLSTYLQTDIRRVRDELAQK